MKRDVPDQVGLGIAIEDEGVKHLQVGASGKGVDPYVPLTERIPIRSEVSAPRVDDRPQGTPLLEFHYAVAIGVTPIDSLFPIHHANPAVPAGIDDLGLVLPGSDPGLVDEVEILPPNLELQSTGVDRDKFLRFANGDLMRRSRARLPGAEPKLFRSVRGQIRLQVDQYPLETAVGVPPRQRLNLGGNGVAVFVGQREDPNVGRDASCQR